MDWKQNSYNKLKWQTVNNYIHVLTNSENVTVENSEENNIADHESLNINIKISQN